MNKKDRAYLIKEAKLIHQSSLSEEQILLRLEVAHEMGGIERLKKEIKRTEDHRIKFNQIKGE